MSLENKDTIFSFSEQPRELHAEYSEKEVINRRIVYFSF